MLALGQRKSLLERRGHIALDWPAQRSRCGYEEIFSTANPAVYRAGRWSHKRQVLLLNERMSRKDYTFVCTSPTGFTDD